MVVVVDVVVVVVVLLNTSLPPLSPIDCLSRTHPWSPRNATTVELVKANASSSSRTTPTLRSVCDTDA
jgi:hypothetical protein